LPADDRTPFSELKHRVAMPGFTEGFETWEEAEEASRFLRP